MNKQVKIYSYSEDGATVYEAHDHSSADQYGRTFAFDSLYVGADDWLYGDREEIAKKVKEFYAKYNAE